MNIKEEFIFAYILKKIPGIGIRKLLPILEKNNNFQETYYQCKRQYGNYCNHDYLSNNYFEKTKKEALYILDKCYDEYITCIPYTSEEYPKKLINCPMPPFYIFIKGNKKILNKTSIVIVGTRKHSEYGKKVVSHIVNDLKGNDIYILSGFAKGIDECAHKTALHHGIKTGAVCGSSVDYIYPFSHRELYKQMLDHNGFFISEYPPTTKPESYHFPMRNRIIAALADAVFVIECKEKSGAMITAHLAAEYNKPVCTIPGDIFSENSQGPHALLKQGACLYSKIEDLFEEVPYLKTSLQTQQKLPLENNNTIEYQILKTLRPQTLEKLISQFPNEPTIYNTIITMEMNKLIIRGEGSIFRIN
ncbi:DNA-processing protein DprA [Candidatus Margulisiibacteriota bacterium]